MRKTDHRGSDASGTCWTPSGTGYAHKCPYRSDPQSACASGYGKDGHARLRNPGTPTSPDLTDFSPPSPFPMKPFCPPISLTELSGKRIRVSEFKSGAAICAVTSQHPVELAAPQPLLGYWYRAGHLTVYVAGPMPVGLRSALEENRAQEEVLLQELPAGIAEIDLTDCRREFRVLPLYQQTLQTAA